jgi:hypothetical protein
MEIKSFEYKFRIGHNNKTKKPEYKKAERIFIRNGVKGFSNNKNILGYWESDSEKSFIIEVLATEQNPFNDTIAKKIKTELETELKQFLVLLSKNEVLVLE